MSWYKATLRDSDGNIRARTLVLQQRFAQGVVAVAPLNPPVSDMAMLCDGDPLEGEVDVYFTPACCGAVA